eukprot:4166880-Amphidinium_carterae.1
MCFKQALQDALDKVKQAKFQSLSLRDQRAFLLSRARQLAEKVDRQCELVDKAVAERDQTCHELYEVQEKLRALPEEPAKASEGCGDATSICGLLQQNVQDGGNSVRPVLEVPQPAQEEGNQVRPVPSGDMDLAGEWTQVGAGGSCKRRSACHDVPSSLPLRGNRGCEHGYRYTTRQGWTSTSTASSWHQAGQAAWSTVAGTGQFGSWRGGRRRTQDQREHSRFAQRRRSPRFCARATAGAQTRPHVSPLDADGGNGCRPLTLQSATAGLTSPGQAGG